MDEGRMASGMREFLDSGCDQVRALRHVQSVLADTGCRAVLFGGVVRDAMLLGAEARPRDLDVVFDGASPWKVRKAFGGENVRMNQMGGLNFDVGGVSVDAWHLHRTWAFHERKFRNPAFEDLLWSASFNIEAGLADIVPELERVYDGGMSEAMRTRVLEMQFPSTPSPTMLVIRAAMFSMRFQMKFGPRLRAFVSENTPPEAEIDASVRKHFLGQTARRILEQLAEAGGP